MLFEVFRCEETDTINNIAIAHFLKVGLFKELIITTKNCDFVIFI